MDLRFFAGKPRICFRRDGTPQAVVGQGFTGHVSQNPEDFEISGVLVYRMQY